MTVPVETTFNASDGRIAQQRPKINSASCSSLKSQKISGTTSETTPWADAGHEPVRVLPLVVAHEQPAGAAGQIGHVRTALIEDQIQVPAEGIC